MNGQVILTEKQELKKKKSQKRKTFQDGKIYLKLKKKITEHNGIMEITKKRVSEPEDGYIEITQFEKDE